MAPAAERFAAVEHDLSLVCEFRDEGRFERINVALADLLTRISAVGEDPLDEREDAARSPQKRSAAVAILDARPMRFEHEATPLRVDERTALASVDLLSSIVPRRPPASVVLTLWHPVHLKD